MTETKLRRFISFRMDIHWLVRLHEEVGMVSRREFLRLTVLAGGALIASRCGAFPRLFLDQTGPTLKADLLPKFTDPLVIPPAMPPVSTDGEFDYFEIAVRQFQQQILPAGQPKTTVWGYGAVNAPETFNYPSFTIEATAGRPTRVKWINDLVDAQGNFLPHLLPVDPSLHWANPEGPETDIRPTFKSTPKPYRGPVPMVTHVHGAHAHEESDGYAEAWFLPAAKNLGKYIPRGKWYETFKNKFKQHHGVDWEPGSATYQYPNDQRAATLWYHDHALGATRLNVYAGPAGFYLLRGGEGDLQDGSLPGPAPALGDAPDTRYYEIPLAIQDRSFNEDGSLFYPSTREFFDGYNQQFVPGTDVPPIWNPEFFGTTMLV
ncbi:MAG: bilirubin oxidase, partial [Anaerolineae bacterium]|nr:bilirubin oxidase [Anaerolineae bacterium]